MNLPGIALLAALLAASAAVVTRGTRAGGVLAAWMRATRSGALSHVRREAGLLGLEVAVTDDEHHASAHGRIEGYDVRLSTWLAPEHAQHYARIDIVVVDPLVARLVIARVGAPEVAPAMKASERVRTSDLVFDSAFVVSGPPGVALAVLDHTTRRALTSLRDVFAVVHHDTLTVLVDPANLPAGALARRVREALSIARRLREGADDPVERLAEALAAEPSDVVRQEQVVGMFRTFPGHPRALAAARDAVARGAGTPPRVLLQAAAVLGDEGVPALLALLARLDTPVMERRGAALALATSPTLRARGTVGLTALMENDMLPAAVEAIALAYARAPWPGVESHLVSALGVLDEAHVLGAIADAIGGQPWGEEALLGVAASAMAQGRYRAFYACVRALGECGELATLGFFDPLLSSGAILPSLEAVQQAVARVRARLRSSHDGALSITAPTQAGALSVTSDRAHQATTAGAQLAHRKPR